MDAQRIAGKLEPLMPERIRTWRRTRDCAEPALRTLLDQELLILAHRVLGDIRAKPLLSLPPKKKAQGAIKLGTILYEKDKWPLGISEGELLQNLAIFGRSGAGKTNAAFLILEHLIRRKTPFLFLDWKRTARELIPRYGKKIRVYTPGRSLAPFPFNPFIVPPGLEATIYINQVIDALGDAYTLGDGARSVLHRAIRQVHDRTSAPTIEELLQAVEAIPDKERVRGWKISAIRALESLGLMNLTEGDQDTQRDFAARLLHENTIVELDGLSAGSRKFLIPMLCVWLYSMRLGMADREQLRFVIFVEEAHHVLYGGPRSHREVVMEMLLRQCREIGIAMVVIDQHPHLISPAALGNTYTTLLFNLKDPKDITKAAALALIDDTDKHFFSELPVGHAIVKLQDRWPRPVLVRVPLVGIEKGRVRDADVRVAQGAWAGRRAGSWPLGLQRGNLTGVRGIRVLEDGVLDEDALRFLEDVWQHPHDGVKQRYQRLGLSGDKGNRLKEHLVHAGWLEAELVPLGTTRKLLLGLTPAAKKSLGITSGGGPHEGVAHAYWKHVCAERFKEEGWRVEIEAKRIGGYVDVLAMRDGERIGIEIETGKSDIVANVRNCLRSRFDRVIVVATDARAMKTVETALGKAGLFIPGRVELVLREQWPPSYLR